jgi:hypothetical protein
MPTAPGKIAVTLNLPEGLKREIGVEAEKRGMRKSHLVQLVLERFLQPFLESLDKEKRK